MKHEMDEDSAILTVHNRATRKSLRVTVHRNVPVRRVST
jgi:hypothetical protein